MHRQLRETQRTRSSLLPLVPRRHRRSSIYRAAAARGRSAAAASATQLARLKRWTHEAQLFAHPCATGSPLGVDDQPARIRQNACKIAPWPATPAHSAFQVREMPTTMAQATPSRAAGGGGGGSASRSLQLAGGAVMHTLTAEELAKHPDSLLASLAASSATDGDTAVVHLDALGDAN